VVVIGGGIAGLAAAHRLRERLGAGAEIVVVDRADRVGGKLRTATLAGQPIETGAETFLMWDRRRTSSRGGGEHDSGAESAVLALARRIGLGRELVHPAPIGAAIALGGMLHPIPAGTLLGIPSRSSHVDTAFVRPGGDDRDTGAPLLSPGEDVAVGRLVRARLGYDVVNHLVEPLLGGVYAGRADRLSLAVTVPALHAAAQREHTLSAAVEAALLASPRPAGSPVFATVRGGISRLVEAVGAAAGAEVRLGHPVRELSRAGTGWSVVLGSTRDPVELRADRIVLAIPARPAARLLAGVSGAAAAEVGKLDYASVVLVNLALPAGTELPPLSGFLVPPTEDYAVKAATFFSHKWPHLAGGGPVFVRASLGRYGEERVLQRTDADLTALALADLAGLLGAAVPEPVQASVHRWGGGLPQYGVGHLDRVRTARSALPPGLALAGAAYDGVGIAACVRSGESAADLLLGAEENGEHE
jgi:oxygen-dependent protoporphyrinogen oxidase